MAAKKFSRSRLSSHADQRRVPTGHRRTSQSRRGSAGSPSAPRPHERKSTDREVRNHSEIVRLLAEALALLQTIRMAMREFEEHPTFGNVCVAFNQAVDVLSRAHSEVGRLLEHRTA